MPKTAKSAEPTITRDLTPDRTTCPHCDGPIRADYANRRTIHTLAGVTGIRVRLKVRLAAAWAAAGDRWRAGAAAVRTVAAAAWAAATVMPLRRFLAVGARVGVAAGLAAYACPHAATAAAANASGACAAVTAQAGGWLLRSAAAFTSPARDDPRRRWRGPALQYSARPIDRPEGRQPARTRSLLSPRGTSHEHAM